MSNLTSAPDGQVSMKKSLVDAKVVLDVLLGRFACGSRCHDHSLSDTKGTRRGSGDEHNLEDAASIRHRDGGRGGDSGSLTVIAAGL